MAVLLSIAASDASAAPAKRPDLVVAKVSNPPILLVRGGAFRASDVTRNRGSQRARKTRTAYYLSKDRKRSKGDVRLKARRSVKALRAGKRSRGKRRVVVPRSTRAGRYRLIACADAGSRVRERRERNNCRASRRAGVLAPRPSPAPAPPAPVVCAPTGADVPDPGFADTNCDGIDGDAAAAVFVAAGFGADGGDCGTRAAPCASIPAGIARAGAVGKSQVYIAGGTYTGGVDVADGISLYGGFGQNFQRGPKATGTSTTAIQGQSSVVVAPSTEPQAIAVLADDLTRPTTLAFLVVFGVDTTAQLPSGQGKSSYAMVVKDVPPNVLTIANNAFVAGDGAPGAAGSPGTSASATPATSGGEGGDSGVPVACEDRGTAGSAASGAGAGGAGGQASTTCAPAGPPGSGEAGGDATGADGAFGGGGTVGGPCLAGGDGENGLVTNGFGGSAGTSGGLLSDGLFWRAAEGGEGTTGDDGRGGGGGGGAGGCDAGGGSYGAGGGGGGAGGAAATDGGDGGKGGGGSFGVYLVDASPRIANNVFNRGAGGKGGDGGAGGQGQPGGAGGQGGDGIASLSQPGGDGGDGGHGGHAGGGGGGSGGISFPIYSTSAASSPVVTANFTLGGTAGLGGAGGAQDEAAGASGSAGPLGTAPGTCASPPAAC